LFHPFDLDTVSLILNLLSTVSTPPADIEISRFETLLINILNNPAIFEFEFLERRKILNMANESLAKLSEHKDSIAWSLVWSLKIIVASDDHSVLIEYLTEQPKGVYRSLPFKHVSYLSPLAADLSARFFKDSLESNPYFLPLEIFDHPYSDKFKNYWHLIGKNLKIETPKLNEMQLNTLSLIQSNASR
jgi:hypothetical protein